MSYREPESWSWSCTSPDPNFRYKSETGNWLTRMQTGPITIQLVLHSIETGPIPERPAPWLGLSHKLWRKFCRKVQKTVSEASTDVPTEMSNWLIFWVGTDTVLSQCDWLVQFSYSTSSFWIFQPLKPVMYFRPTGATIWLLRDYQWYMTNILQPLGHISLSAVSPKVTPTLMDLRSLV